MKTESLEILEQASVPPVQARAIVKAIELEIGDTRESLSTKQELHEFRVEMRQALQDLRACVDKSMASLRSDSELQMANLKCGLKDDIGRSHGEVMRWVVLVAMAQGAMLLGAAYFAINYLLR